MLHSYSLAAIWRYRWTIPKKLLQIGFLSLDFTDAQTSPERIYQST
jgi:hypothetical protein